MEKIESLEASTEGASESNIEIEEHAGSSTDSTEETTIQCNVNNSKTEENNNKFMLLKIEVQNQRLGVLQDGKYIELNREHKSQLYEFFKNRLENLAKNINHLDSKESQFDVDFKQIMKESVELNNTFIEITVLSGMLSDSIDQKNSLKKKQNELNQELEDLDNKNEDLKEKLSKCLQDIDAIKAENACYEKLKADSLARLKPICDEWQKQKSEFEYLTQKLNELTVKQNSMNDAETSNV